MLPFRPLVVVSIAGCLPITNDFDTGTSTETGSTTTTTSTLSVSTTPSTSTTDPWTTWTATLPPGCDVPPVPGPTVPTVPLLVADVARATVTASGWLGAAAMLGDLDGDGFGDFAVGGMGCVPPCLDTGGEVWFYDGDQTGALDRFDANAWITRVVLQDLENVPRRLLVGDLTGDARPELFLVPEEAVNCAGSDAFAVTLPVPPGVWAIEDLATVVFRDDPSRCAHGWSLGDLDGDGHTDLAVGGLGAHFGVVATGFLDDYGGGVAVYQGPLAAMIDPAVDPADATFEIGAWDRGAVGDRSSGRFTAAFLPDLNGDGGSDLFVGGDVMENLVEAPTTPYGLEEGHGGMGLFVGRGIGSWDADDAQAQLYGVCSAGITGDKTAALGDVTGDGRVDVAIPGLWAGVGGLDQRGAVWVLTALDAASGTASVTTAAGAVILGATAGDRLSEAIGLGDINGDGIDDFAVAAPNALGGDGAVYVFLGPVTGTVVADAADVILTGSNGEGLGWSMAAGEDLDADGVGDLIVTNWAWDVFYGGPSVVYVLSGATLVP